MRYTELGVVEKPILKWLQSLGWKYVNPEEMNARRGDDFEEALVVEDFKESLKKVNSGVEFTDADLDFIVISLRGISSNIDGVRKFLDIFRNGLVVPLQKEGKERVVKIVDLDNIENNSFAVTNQYRVEGSKAGVRADVVVSINAIPLVVIECKNPTVEEVDWLDAYKQLKRYEEQVPEIFKYVQFSIATDGIKTYYFPNAFLEYDNDLLGVWKDTYPLKPEKLGNDLLKTTVYGMLSKQNLLDLIENFTFVRKEKTKATKIATRYMQYRASNKIFTRVLDTLSKRSKDKFGLIWHWQGSGKTYTMAFAAWKLLHEAETKRPSIFVIVDRRDLEEQVERDFSFIEVPLEKIRSIHHLIEVLTWGREGKRGIFLVTIEKFSPKEFAQLNKKAGKLEIERENIIVLADEVHRTQYGKFATLMRSVFKNAFVFGFTGTPLSIVERNTFQKFCPTGELYLDRYSMLDAMKDGFTVPLSYEARLPGYHLKPEELKRLKVFEDEELKDLSLEERKRLRRRIKVIKEFLKKHERVDAVVKDVVAHFKDVVAPTGLKAMIVTCDRAACIKYKQAIDKLLPASSSEIVMTPDPNKKDIRTYFEQLRGEYGGKLDKEIHNDIIDNFGSKTEPKILIVTDMLITGFNAPNLWTMYLDKPLKEHRILQAIARTNRPYQSKKFGLIVDYIGALKELEDAFGKFEAGDATNLRVVIRNLDAEKEEFEKLLKNCLEIFRDVKKEDTRESLNDALDVLINLEKSKKFETLMKDIMKSFEMLSGEPFLREHLSSYTWLVRIYVAYNKKFKKAGMDELKIESLSKKTINLIKKTIDVKGIEDSFPVVSIDEKYVEALKKSKPTEVGAAIDILTSIQHEGRAHQISPFFRSLSKEVQKTFEELRAKKIKTKEAVQRASDFSAKIVEWKKQKEKIGPEKYPLYETIKTIIPGSDERKVIEFSTNLLKHLRQKRLLFEGWHRQRDVRRKVKAETRILLLAKFKEYKKKIDDLEEGLFDALEEMATQ